MSCRRRVVRKRTLCKRPQHAALRALAGMKPRRFFEDVFERDPRVLGSPESQDLASALGEWPAFLVNCAAARDKQALLVMKDQTPANGSYDSVEAAWLDGCSFIINHFENFDAKVHALCRQLRRDVPHAYVNAYATPARGKAVEAHADDRDVLVLQLSGSKKWKVYAEPPVRLPYFHEQAGKAGQPIPETTFDDVALDITLQAGGVLYMPRGYVHEAETRSDEASLHLTIALATAEWSWENVIASAGLERNGASDAFWEFLKRKAVPRAFSSKCSVSDQEEEAARCMSRTVADVAAAYDAQMRGVNAQQDASRPLLSFGAGPEFVRRRRSDDPPQLQASAAGGVLARDELADHIPIVVASVTAAAATRVADFEEAPCFCSLSKLCLARLCVDLGLFVACDAEANYIDL
ncbi:hypothetical protein M885DRAFT_522524, partial [Pelagophyceae sp. CCMP2097]